MRLKYILLAVLLALFSAFISLKASETLVPISVITDQFTSDLWFGADIVRVFNNATDRHSDAYRNSVHPLFSIMHYPVISSLKMLGMDTFMAVRSFYALLSGLWVVCLFSLLSFIGLGPLSASLFSLLGSLSASALFWMGVPETYLLGSITLMAPLLLVAASRYRTFSDRWFILASILSLSITTSNWMSGLIATWFKLPWRRFIKVTLIAISITAFLAIVQRLFFFGSGLFFLGSGEDKKYTFVPNPERLLEILKAFFMDPLVMPRIQVLPNTLFLFLHRSDQLMSIQKSLPGSGGMAGLVACLLWLALLAFGFYVLRTLWKKTLFVRILLLTLAGQFLLHLVYGEETFLYSLHFLPLLILVAAYGTLTRWRPGVNILAGILMILLVVNNGKQIEVAKNLVEQYSDSIGRLALKRAMVFRPDDPWPRGVGHVVLAEPGSLEVDKSYHEPGGSFSPGASSFGVSIWLRDDKDHLVKTSDSLPLDAIEQHLIRREGSSVPAINSSNGEFSSVWSYQSSGVWSLNLSTVAGGSLKPEIVIRSVGPAGGPLFKIDREDHTLILNDRWEVSLASSPVAIYLGDENVEGWKDAPPTQNHWAGKNGWGYARFILNGQGPWELKIIDSKAKPLSAVAGTIPEKPGFRADLPDSRFIDSINAQTAHLLMGLVKNETRPSEPLSYPDQWLRDGAYVLVALARAGQLNTVRKLSVSFAENDFFGGFGPEADEPGLSIWALTEVSRALHDPEFDRWLWPHIQRKAKLIVTMLNADKFIRMPVLSPTAPSMEDYPSFGIICLPARDGLIRGRMDQSFPLLYINATAYMGLIEAENLARRLDHPFETASWGENAGLLKTAWHQTLRPSLPGNKWQQLPLLVADSWALSRQGIDTKGLRRNIREQLGTMSEWVNPRTYIVGLWPSNIAAGVVDYRKGLELKWQQKDHWDAKFNQSLPWSNFEFGETHQWLYLLGETHQWLYLGDTSKVWETLNWFWDHSDSPGLYTWGEGNGNEYFRWNKIRGWINPPNITPHYWTAAEMLLLQFDMLTYLDTTGARPEWVIGSGVPQEWLSSPLHVEGLITKGATINWHWKNGTMQVTVHGNPQHFPVRLGKNFPANAKLAISYLDDGA